MTPERSAEARAGSLASMLSPRSIAIIGMSAKPGSTGQAILQSLRQDNFQGPIHLVGRSGGEVAGQPVLTSVDDLPPNVDLALITVPAEGVVEAVEGVARNGIAAAIVYASGFAELGQEGREAQARLSQVSRDSGLLLAGPNCIGHTNFVAGITTIFLPQPPTPRIAPGATGALAVLAQSGGLMGMITHGLQTRRILTSYRISSGNEAGLTLADYLGYLADDPATGGFVVYSEEIRDPAAFVSAIRKARSLGKFVVITQSGRSEHGQQATSSHTGSLAADYGVMKTVVTEAGACVVESLEELLDVAEILSRYPQPPSGGIGIATTSGAFCAIALDTLEPLGVEVPPLSSSTEAALQAKLPSFLKAANPLDLGTGDPGRWPLSVAAMLGDDRIGSLIIGIPSLSPAFDQDMMRAFAEAASGQPKPVAVGLFADVAPISDELRSIAADGGVIVGNSPERLMRAMARVTRFGRRPMTSDTAKTAVTVPLGLPALGPGPQPEWVGKKILSAMGIAVPDGELARTVEEAVKVADRVGYPLAAKIQAAELQHKTEAGAVMLGIADESALREAWVRLAERATAAGLPQTDGILIEAMAPNGVELMVGAKRIPGWGPVVMVGLGGVWVEALGDVRLLSPYLPEDAIAGELRKLRAAKLLGEFRGSAAVDLAAVARVVTAVQRLMLGRPDISELDINPLSARPDGAIALDALVVCALDNKEEVPV